MDQPIGLYIHIPYCRCKCNYCDFYSLPGVNDPAVYTAAVCRTLEQMGQRYPRTADTLYFGGGTPPMLGKEGLSSILSAAQRAFPFSQQAEITCEMNPGAGYAASVEELAAMGVNRLSVGLQSALPAELAALGRRHSPEDVRELLMRARRAGIANCSVDLMWGIPGQTPASALQSVDFALSLQPTHISAYLLKLEPDTPFGKDPPPLPEEETVCEIYERCCERLEQAGFLRYEISNFARAGFESRHNLKYWNCDETLGIGPAAHSFMEGKRFFYPRDLKGFLQGAAPVPDGTGGDFTEYAMLQLRLRKGLQIARCRERFGHGLPEKMVQNAEPMVRHGLVQLDEQGLRLTLQGNLVSNEILAQLL